VDQDGLVADGGSLAVGNMFSVPSSRFSVKTEGFPALGTEN